MKLVVDTGVLIAALISRGKLFKSSLDNIEQEVYGMPTVSVSTESVRKIKAFPKENWSEVIDEAVEEHARRLFLLKFFDKALEKSELTDEDCVKLSRELKRGRFEQLKKQGLI